MKITERFIGDHKTFKKLMNDLDQMAAKPPAQWDQKKLIRWVELFKDHLILHAWGEETFYYPKVLARVPLNGPVINASYMNHLDLEHLSIDKLIDQLELQVKEKPINPKWGQTYQLFSQNLLAHIDKEENELFPFSDGLLGQIALEQISTELEQRRKEAPAIRRHSSF